MTRRKKRDKKSVGFFIKLILTAAVLIILIYFADSFFNAPIKASAEYKSKQIASEIINSAVTNAIENCGYTYNDLTVIRRNSDNNVVSIEANTVNLTKLQSAVTENIINELNSVNHMTAKIPLGALLGSSLLSGMDLI